MSRCVGTRLCAFKERSLNQKDWQSRPPPRSPPKNRLRKKKSKLRTKPQSPYELFVLSQMRKARWLLQHPRDCPQELL